MMLANKKLLIIGGANGMGRALVDHGIAEGAQRITVFDVDNNAATDLQGAGLDFRQVDITDFGALSTELTNAWEAADGFDGVVNCAGLGIPRLIADTSVAEFQAHLDLNLIPSQILFRELGPRMRQRGAGSIVTVASLSGVDPLYGNASYGAAKAGLIALTKVAALELGPEVRCNVVAPGTIATRLTGIIESTPAFGDPIIEVTPLGRLGRPSELADTMAFLLSDYSSYTTGQVLIVDGGATITQPGMGPMTDAVPELLSDIYLSNKPTPQ